MVDVMADAGAEAGAEAVNNISTEKTNLQEEGIELLEEFKRLVDNATLLSCSEFGQTLISDM